MSEKEIEDDMIKSKTWHRPTWNRHNWDHHNDHFDDPFDLFHEKQAPEPDIKLKTQYQQALAILNLSWPTTLKEVKTQYKKLSKKYHPDLTNNNKILEEKFKQINQAYGQLKSLFQTLNRNT